MERFVDQRLGELLQQKELSDSLAGKLRRFLEILESDPRAATTVKGAEEAVDVHIADSLEVLKISEFKGAKTVLDLGSGAGIPSVPLAIVCPETEFKAVESIGKKCEFIRDAAASLKLRNLEVCNTRAEEYAGLRADLAMARAVAPLGVLLEYAAPLLELNGTFVAWKGDVSEGEIAGARRAAEILGMVPVRVVEATPYKGSRCRTLHIYSKAHETPTRFPRRPGMAKKRPL